MPYHELPETQFNQKYQALLSFLKLHENTLLPDILIALDQLPNDHILKDLFVVNAAGKSFLHLAAAEENLELLAFLKETGHEINKPDNNNKTPLYDACEKLKIKSVNALLNYRADPNLGDSHLLFEDVREIDGENKQVNYKGETIPLVAAIESKAVVSVEQLPAITDINYSRLNKAELTEHAAAIIVKKLIDSGVAINLQTGVDHFSALHRGVALGKPLIVKTLAENHADFTLLSVDRMSALHMLVAYRSADEIQQRDAQIQMQKEKQVADIVIPRSGPVYKLKAEFGNTALHTAVIGGNSYVVKKLCTMDYLFPQEKLLSITNDNGNSAIHEALLETYRDRDLATPKVLDILLRLATDADLAIVNARGESVKLLAERLIVEAQLTHNLVASTILVSNGLEDFFLGKDITGKHVIDFEEFTQFEEIINELRDTEHLDNDLPRVSKQLDDIHAELNAIKQRNWISIEETEDLHQTVNTLLAEINERYSDVSYIQTLASVRELGLQAWMQEKLLLPNSFTGLERAANHEIELAAATTEYNSALNRLNTGDTVNAKIEILSSIERYIALKEYNFLEKPYEVLARLATGTTNEIKEYELNQKAILNNPVSNHNQQLKAHMALASLYQTLRKEGKFGQPSFPTVTAYNLFERESLHFSEVYKFTQGELDPDAHVVLQREMGVSTNGAKLGTSNVQQCLVAIVHDPRTGKFVASHFDRYSGPLKFIDQILEEFPNVNRRDKLDVYITGGRDRSEVKNPQANEPSGKEIAESNIKQVLKQLRVYDHLLNIREMSVGDKLSPPAVVFDPQAPDGQRLQHRMPNRADSSLDSRASVMNIEASNPNEYLQPLRKIDFSENELSRKMTFSEAQLNAKYNEFWHWYGDFPPNNNYYSEAWKHNQLFKSLLACRNEANNGIMAQPAQSFDQGLFQGLNNYGAGIAQRMNLNVASFRQQNNQPSMDLIEVLRQPPQTAAASASHQEPPQDENESSNELSEASAMSDDEQEWDEASPAKRICLPRRKREVVEEVVDCFSREEVEEFTEKESPLDGEKIKIDSERFLDSLNRADPVKRIELLKFAAESQLTGEQTPKVEKLISIARLKSHLAKVEKISSITMDAMFTWDALMSLKGDKLALAQLVYLKGFQHLSEKAAQYLSEQAIKLSNLGNTQAKLLGVGAPIVRGLPQIFNDLLIGDDLYENIQVLLKDSGNTHALVNVLSDGTQLAVDLTSLGVRTLEMSSEAFAALEYSTVVDPLGGVIVVTVMIDVRIYEAVAKVDEENHVLHLNFVDKTTEFTRAFLHMDSAYQKTLDEIDGYEKDIFPQVSNFFANHPDFLHIILTAINKVGEVTWCAHRAYKGCRTKQSRPIFQEVENNSVFLTAKSNDFKRMKESITPPVGSELLCVPTDVEGETLPAQGAFRCDGAIGLSNTNNTLADKAFIKLGNGTDRIEGFSDLSNVILMGDGDKNVSGGNRSDQFILQPTQIVTGVFNGGEGDDVFMLQGLQPNATHIDINLAEGNLTYGNNTLQLISIEKIIGGSFPLNITVAADTQEIQLLGFSQLEMQHTVLIPNTSHPDTLKMYLQSSAQVINEAQGNFTYYVLPGNGTSSVDLSAQEDNAQTQHQFVFNELINNLDSIQISNSSDPKASKTLKFHFKVDPLEKLLRQIQSISFVKTMSSSNVTITYNYHSESSKAFNLAPALPTELPSVEMSNLIENYKHPMVFHYMTTITQPNELQRALSYLVAKVANGYKDDFKFELTSRPSHRIRLNFIDQAELRIGNKFLYFLKGDLKQPVSQILKEYNPIAEKLDLKFSLKTNENEQVEIGNNADEIMQNDPTASRTHLHGSVGHMTVSIRSGMPTLVLSHLPIPEVVIYHSAEQKIKISFQSIVKQIQASGGNYKLSFIKPNAQNRLGNDLLLSLMLVSATSQQMYEVATVRLADAYPSRWPEKDVYILLNKALQKIVAGRHHHLDLGSVPLEFDLKSGIALLDVAQVEADTDLIIPLNSESVDLLQHNATNLILTNALGNHDSNQTAPSAVIIKDFFKEPELQTLHVQFNDTKIALNLTQLPMLKKFKIEKNKLMKELDNEWFDILPNTSHLPATTQSTNTSAIAAGLEESNDIYSSEESNTINPLLRQRRAAEYLEEPSVSNVAEKQTGIRQTLVHTVKNSMQTIFSSDAERNNRDQLLEMANDYYDRRDRLKVSTQKKGTERSKKRTEFSAINSKSPLKANSFQSSPSPKLKSPAISSQGKYAKHNQPQLQPFNATRNPQPIFNQPLLSKVPSQEKSRPLHSVKGAFFTNQQPINHNANPKLPTDKHFKQKQLTHEKPNQQYNNHSSQQHPSAKKVDRLLNVGDAVLLLHAFSGIKISQPPKLPNKIGKYVDKKRSEPIVKYQNRIDIR